jgi:molybdopterin-biosynthesis enzyme MoeA-like protein
MPTTSVDTMLELSLDRLGRLNVGAGATSDDSSSCAASQTLMQEQSVQASLIAQIQAEDRARMALMQEASFQASVIAQMQAENRALQAQVYEMRILAQSHAAAQGKM